MEETKVIGEFVKRSVIIFVILGLLCAGTFYWLVPEHYFPFVPVIFLYFFIVNYLVFRFLVKSNSLSIHKFSRRFITLTFAKFFGSFLFFAVFLFLNPQRVIPFLVIFITLYFTSLIQEVYDFLRFLKKRSVN